MKKVFKRFLSSALATVMAVAGMTIGMATTASAADGDFVLSAKDFYPTSTGSKIKPDVNPVSENGVYTAEITSKTKTFTPGPIGTYKSCVNSTSFDYEMLAGGDRTITVTPVNSGTATVYVYHDGTKNFKLNGIAVATTAAAYTVTGYNVSCEAGGSFTIDLASNIVFVGLEYVAGEVTTYNWDLDTTGLVNVDPSGLALGSDTATSLSNTLSYTGSDYMLKDEYKNITDATDGVTVTGTNVVVKPTDDWFEEVVVAGVIDDKATLIADSKFDALTADRVVSDYFTLLNGISADSSTQSVEGLGDYEFRFRANGKTTLSNGVPSNRAIMFTTAGAGTLQVVAMAGNSTSTRDYRVYASDGTVIATNSVVGSECVQSDLITLPKADTYYIACPSEACNFYSINVVIGSGLTTATGGNVFADTVNSYAIATVSAADLASDSLDVVIGNFTDSTETVFEQVVIDGHLITAGELGADYIYAVGVIGANGASFDFTTKLN